jgi:hypothetical protein
MVATMVEMFFRSNFYVDANAVLKKNRLRCLLMILFSILKDTELLHSMLADVSMPRNRGWGTMAHVVPE